MPDSQSTTKAQAPTSYVRLSVFLLLLVNLAIVAKLFGVEYSAYTGSIEGTFIAIPRIMAKYPGQWQWWPFWNGGLPFECAYLPFTHWLVAGFSLLTRLSAARSFHIVTAGIYLRQRAGGVLDGPGTQPAVGREPDCRADILVGLGLRVAGAGNCRGCRWRAESAAPAMPGLLWGVSSHGCSGAAAGGGGLLLARAHHAPGEMAIAGRRCGRMCGAEQCVWDCDAGAGIGVLVNGLSATSLVEGAAHRRGNRRADVLLDFALAEPEP